MVRQSNGPIRQARGGFRGGPRGRGMGRGGYGDIYFGGRGGIQKPPPLMARPMPPPSNMRLDHFRGPVRPPPPPLMPPMPGMNDFRRMGPSRMSHPPVNSFRGSPSYRMGPRGRGGTQSPLLRGMPPNSRPRVPGGLLPPPLPLPRTPGPPRHMFGPRPPIVPRMMGPLGMRGRGMPGRMPRGVPGGRGIIMGREGPSNRREGKPQRGRGAKNSSTSPSREINKPWVTEAMKNEILKKHKLHQKAKKSRTKEDWHELWEQFKEHRNKVTTMLREAKLEYIGAHPEEDVDKILAEATTELSHKDEPTDPDDKSTAPNVTEGVEPMEEGGGANEAEPCPQDPEVEMKQEMSTDPEQTAIDSETEPKPDSELESRLESESKSVA